MNGFVVFAIVMLVITTAQAFFVWSIDEFQTGWSWFMAFLVFIQIVCLGVQVALSS